MASNHGGTTDSPIDYPLRRRHSPYRPRLHYLPLQNIASICGGGSEAKWRVGCYEGDREGEQAGCGKKK